VAVCVVVWSLAVSGHAWASVPIQASRVVTVPGAVPVATVLTNPITVLSTDALGAPSQPPVKTDAMMVKGVQPAFDSKRQVQSMGQSHTENATPGCDGYGEWGWFYDNLSPRKTQFVQGHSKTYGMNNTTSTEQHYTVTSSKTESIRLGTQGGVEVSVNLVVAKVGGKFGLDVSGSIDWSTTRSATITVPPHKNYVTAYGVFRVVTSGHYYYVDKWCDVTADKGTVTTYTPWYEGWRVKEV
jgi:hypothetical protein